MLLLCMLLLCMLLLCTWGGTYTYRLVHCVTLSGF